MSSYYFTCSAQRSGEGCVLEILPQKRYGIEKVSKSPGKRKLAVALNKSSKMVPIEGNISLPECARPVDRHSSARVHSLVLGGMALLIIKQNLFRAVVYNMVTIPVTAMDKLNPMIALAMAFSSILVVLNPLRLQRKQE